MKHVYLTALAGLSLLMSQASIAQDYKLTVLSDIHYTVDNIDMAYAPNKDHPGSDLDKNNLNKLFNLINVNNMPYSDADSILITGDSVGHHSVDRSKVLKTVLNQLKSWNKPLIYTHGNNDSLSDNYQEFESNGQSSYSIIKELWPASASGFITNAQEDCSNSLKLYPCMLSENTNDGYFAAALQENLAIISLNSVMFDGDYGDIYQDGAQAELKWFNKTLLSLAKQNYSVIISMHVPPSINLYGDHNKSHWKALNGETESFFKAFTNTLNQATTANDQGEKANVIAILAGHTHNDETSLLRLNNQTLIPIFVTPGLSTSHGNSPGFKTYNLQSNHGRWFISDFHSYSITDKASSFSSYNANMVDFCQSMQLNTCVENYSQNLDALMDYVSPRYAAGNPYATPIHKNSSLLLRQQSS